MKKMIARAVCATLVAGVFSVDASAGNLVRLDDSRNLGLANSPTAVVYSALAEAGAPANSFVAEIEIDGFLMCNYFDASPSAVQGHELTRIRPAHGGWVFGNLGDTGLSMSVPGVRSIGYENQQLHLETCNLATYSKSDPQPGGDPACGGAATQCYVADANGSGVSDTRFFFQHGFDDQNTSSESWVSIVNVINPTPSAPYLQYTIVFETPAGGSSSQPNGFSVTADTYVLKEGYDQSLFTICEIPGVDLNVRRCWLADSDLSDWNALPGDQPVASAVIFTGPSVVEFDYSDNVAFAFPTP